MRRGVLLACAAGCVALLVVGASWALKDRDYPASTVQPPPLYVAQTLTVKPSQTACMTDVTVESHSQQLLFQVGTVGKPGPAIEVTLRWPGVVERRTAPAGYPDNSVLAVRFDPPSSARLATLCFKNRGRIAAYLYGSDGARQPGQEVFGGNASRSTTRVDGRPSSTNVVASFYEAGPRSILKRAPVTASRVATFRPVGAWLVWVFAVLFAIGIPIGLGWALWRAADDDG